MTNQNPLDASSATQLPNPWEVSPVNTALRHGLIGALVAIAFGLVFNLMGWVDYTDQSNPGNIANSLIGIAIFTVAMVFAIKFHRDEELGGFIQFGRAFRTSFLTGLFLSLAVSIWIFIFFSFVQPEIIDTIREVAWDQAIEDGASEEDMERGKAFFDMFTSPASYAIFGFIFNIIVSVVLALITSAILKKEN